LEAKEIKETLRTLSKRQVGAIKAYFDKSCSPEMFMLIDKDDINVTFEVGRVKGAVSAARGFLRAIALAKKD